MAGHEKPLVGILMGSKSDWETMKNVSETLDKFGVPSESRVLSAHRTPKETAEYVTSAAGRGIEVLVAGAGGAAHLAGVAAAHTTLRSSACRWRARRSRVSTRSSRLP